MEEKFKLTYYFFDLQQFAAEDEGRTEEPSERIKREKKQEGKIPKSQDLTGAFVFLAVIWAMLLFWSGIYQSLKAMIIHYLSSFSTVDFNLKNYRQGFSKGLWYFLKILLFPFGAAFLFGLLGNLIQVGFVFSPGALVPKFEKISFTFEKLTSRLGFSRQALAHLGISIGKIIILTTIFIFIIYNDMDKIFHLMTLNLNVSIKILFNSLITIANVAGLFLLLWGIPDLLQKRKTFRESLLITKEQAKREHKQEEGDPQFKLRLREMYQQILQKEDLKKNIPKADVVLMNPTHFAVALKYTIDHMSYPTVIAKGEDKMALLIKELALEHHIKIIHNPPLTRELYKLTKVGDYIPEHLTVIIAEIFVQLYEEGKWSFGDYNRQFG